MAFLIRGVTLHESSSYSREDYLGDCGCPCDPLSCLLFSALWLRCSQSILVQETESAKDVDLTCSATSLFREVTCLPVGPMSLDWPVDPFGRSDSSRPLLPPDVPGGVQQRGAFSSFYTPSLETGCSSSTTADITTSYRVGWMWSLPFRRHAMYYLKHPGPRWIFFYKTKEQRFQTQISLKNSWTTTTSFVSRKYMERTSFCKLSRCWLRDLGSLVPFFLTTKMREDQLSAFTGPSSSSGDCDTRGYLPRP